MDSLALNIECCDSSWGDFYGYFFCMSRKISEKYGFTGSGFAGNKYMRVCTLHRVIDSYLLLA